MSKQSDNGDDEGFEKSSSKISGSKSGSQNEISSQGNFDIKTSHGMSSGLPKNKSERLTPETSLDDYQQEIFNDESNLPDLKVQCPTCDSYLSLEELKDHNEFHEAITFFGLKELPENLEQLAEKRKILIKQLSSKLIKKPHDINVSIKINEWHSKVKQINDKYELIKSYMNNTFEAVRQLTLNNLDEQFKSVQGESQITTNECICAIGTCSFQNKKHRIQMEDTNVILDQFGENKNLTYIGTFDGYDGFVASNKCSVHLHLAILHYLSKSPILNSNMNHVLNDGYFDFDEINNLAKYYTNKSDLDYFKENILIPIQNNYDNINNDNNNSSMISPKSNRQVDLNFIDKEKDVILEYKNSFKYAYNQMDKLLARGRDETSKTRWSGATGCTCVIERDSVTNTNWIHVANCGDVECLVITYNNKINKNYRKNISKQRKYRILTRLHTLNDCVQDRENLVRKGCNIIQTPTGEKKIKGIYSFTRAFGFNGDKSIKPFIHSNPSTKSVKIEPNFACLIIATKGFWNVLSYEKVADITNDLFDSFSRTSAINNKESLRFQGLNLIDSSIHYEHSVNNFETSNKIIEENEEIYDNDSQKNNNDNNNSESRLISNKTISHSVISSSSASGSSSSSISSRSDSKILLEKSSNYEYKVDDSEYNYNFTKSSRPRTAPASKLSQNKEEKKTLIMSQKDFTQIDNYHHDSNNNDFNTINNNETETNILESVVIKQPIVIESGVEPMRFKSNSDIYPSSRKNILMNESHDQNIDIKEMELMEKSAIKYVYMSNSTFSSDYSNEIMNFSKQKDESDLFNLTKTNKEKQNRILKNKQEKNIDITSTSVKAEQINDYDLKKTNLKLMKDRKAAKRLEFSQMLAENLVKCALLAGSVDNITVNCVLLNDSLF